ncbi:hypothetical protein NB705_001754 [Xanthomonas sacchari]|nr:hypothetical protein [Xanthomonas sacchari]
MPLLPFDALPWDALGGELATADSGARYPRDLLALPDGDLLLSMQVLGGTGASTRLWRLHHDGTRWQTETVWQGEGGAQRLMSDAQGSRVWFLAGAAGESAVLYAYDVASRRLHRYRVDGEGSDGYARWELDAAQRPVYFDHSYAGGGGAFGSSRFILNAPTAAVPAADGPWAFAPVFGAPRQALMDAAKKGNAQLWPVRLRDPHALWVEDAQGIAALDPTSGRVLRAFALPQRFGRPDPVDASGVAQWVPTPLGSLQGRWIASGFVLMLADHGTGTPQFAPSGASKAQPEARFVGRQFAVDQRGQLLPVVQLELVRRGAVGRRHRLGKGRAIGHTRCRSRVALSVSSRGRSSASMASRARKIRERTVPIGQPIFCAMSS